MIVVVRERLVHLIESYVELIGYDFGQLSGIDVHLGYLEYRDAPPFEPRLPAERILRLYNCHACIFTLVAFSRLVDRGTLACKTT
jgi:hypothetical protein